MLYFNVCFLTWERKKENVDGNFPSTLPKYLQNF